MKIGFLGPKASFTYAAARAAFPDSSHQLIAFDSITEVIRSYEQDLVDFAIVPVENSIEGSVHQTVDYLFYKRMTLGLRLKSSNQSSNSSWRQVRTKRLRKFFLIPMRLRNR